MANVLKAQVEKNDFPSSKTITKNRNVVIVPTTIDKSIRPKSLNNFSVIDLTYRDVTIVADFINAPKKSQIILADVLNLSGGTYGSLPSQMDPTELVIIADTLIISGNNVFDLSKNKRQLNGYLAIFCRVLKISNKGYLNIKLCNDSKNQYRQFSLFTEGIILDDEKVFDNAKVIKERIKRIDLLPMQTDGIVISKFAIYKKATEKNSVKKSIPQNSTISYISFPLISLFYTNVCHNLSTTVTIIPGGDNFFNKWVVNIHQKIYGDLLKQDIQVNNVVFAKKYLRVMQLQKYSPSSPYNIQLNQTREAISTLRDTRIGKGLCFVRKIVIDNNEYQIISFLTENGLQNILPPDKCLLKPTIRNNTIMLGYFVYDKENVEELNLEFEMTLINSSDIYNKLSGYLEKNGERLNPFSDRLQFENSTLTGPDLVDQKCRVAITGNNQYKIKLVTAVNSSIIFYKLFEKNTSDIFLNAKWRSPGNELEGKINIPLYLSRMDYPVTIQTKDSIINLMDLPITIDLSKLDISNVTSNNIALEPHTSIKIPSPFFGKENFKIRPDNIIIGLNADKYSDYFELFDESDKLTQDLMVYNDMPSTPVDSISGTLKYADLSITFQYLKAGTTEKITIQKQLQLPPSTSLGSNANIEILKPGKEYIPVTVRGTLFFENGEYKIKPQMLDEGETIFHLTYNLLEIIGEK